MFSAITILLSSVHNKNPMSLVIIVIMNSLTVALMTFKATMDLWTSILLLMVYVSGVMVLFMYVVSLSPLKISKSGTKKLVSTILASLFIMYIGEKHLATIKELSKFTYTFEKQMSAVLLLIMMLVVMGAIIPSVSMTSFKGLKSSN